MSIGVFPAFLTGMITSTYPPAIVAGPTLLRSRASSVARSGCLATSVVLGTLMGAAPVAATYASTESPGARSGPVPHRTPGTRRGPRRGTPPPAGAGVSSGSGSPARPSLRIGP